MKKSRVHIEHTIDNLCPEHASKVVEMLKQLTHLRRRCHALEEQLGCVHNTESDLIRLNAEMEESIPIEENDLWEATQRSSNDQETIRSLTIKHQQLETETSLLRLKVMQQ
jgi:hypothetical protein